MIRGLTTGRRAALALATCLLPAGLAEAAGPDFADREDFAFADRGFVAQRSDPLIKAADGRVVWDLDAYRFLDAPAPATVNPSLWRQAQLLSKSGLYKVADGVWQVRGLDLANITFIAGKTGWIIVDPLTSTEVAAAALELANQQLGARPVTALIYTHSHADHFAGARGVVSDKEIAERKIPVVAPKGFLEHAVSENIIAGGAMNRRGAFQFGAHLPKGPTGQVNSGIGMAVSPGTMSLIPPNLEIERTGQTLELDGVKMVFQFTPGTEAPAEMNFLLPDLRVLCMAENANATMHNVLTPRGALVRDAKAWADGLSEAIDLFGAQTDVVFTSHAWPRFGQAEAIEYLSKHRDAYKYLHDQSVRLMNAGLTPDEIANRLKLPPVLDNAWYNRGYYGTVSFNSRAVYQRYMGWYDANPVNLAPLEPADEARRYVEAMGGRKPVLTRATAAHAAGDQRWAAELLNRLVFADPKDQEARDLLAKVYDAQGFAAESAIGRNMYLSAATELREGVKPAASAAAAPLDFLRNTPTSMLLDLMAVRLDPALAGDKAAVVVLRFTDRREAVRVSVRNAVLTHSAVAMDAQVEADATVTLPRPMFLAMALGGAAPEAILKGAAVTGSPETVSAMFGWFDKGRVDFPVLWSASEPKTR